MGESALALDAEIAKYVEAYRRDGYRMSDKRRIPSVDALARCARGSYLDIGCGRGEMLREADALGFSPCVGIDPVRALGHIPAMATSIPFADGSFDAVSLFDVIEHLPRGNEVLALAEADRVARLAFVVSANNQRSRRNGHDLHINIRSYTEWDSLFRAAWRGQVDRIHDGFSPIWLCMRAF